MEYYELLITCYLHKNIYFTETNEIIALNINKAMLLDSELSKMHEKNEFKFYSFNSFYPLEEDKTYKAGRVYLFLLRSLDKKFIYKIKRLIKQIQSEDFKILSIEEKTIHQKHITEIYTMTPAVITLENNHNWIPGDNFILLQDRFHANLEKKYKAFFNEELNAIQNFIQRIEIINRKPFSFKYKNTKILGNKFKLFINEDEASQDLAFIAAAAGIGEKSSALGMGFCKAEYLK